MGRLTKKEIQFENELLEAANMLIQSKLTSERNDSVEQSNVTVKRAFFDYMAASLRNTKYPGVQKYTEYKVAREGLVPLTSKLEPLKPDFGTVFNDILSFQYPISIAPCKIVN